jgi:hypothetical protein
MFSPDYSTAKERFLTSARKAGASLAQLTLPVKGPRDEDLTIDIATLGSPEATQLLLHTSGIHGVEGFAGSAIQLAALASIQPPADVRLVYVHALNPFGMAWLRRVNESNVDLNRNFLEGGQPYRGSPKAYTELDPFLNPREAKGFWPRLTYNLLRHGFRPLKNAIVEGQYDFPRGLFFGGRELEDGPRLYKQWLKENAGAPSKVVAVDVHTGLGGYGKEVLFCHTNQTPPNLGKKVTALSATVGYKVRGGLECLTAEVFPQAHWFHYTEELGTYSMARVLKALREENAHYHTQRAMSTILARVMSPEDERWRKTVVAEGLDTLSRALQWLGKV